jgi:phosphatidate cytidylyltransferase
MTAMGLIPLLFFSVFYLPLFYFKGVASLVVGLAAWEWSRLSGYQSMATRFSYVLLTLCGLGGIEYLPQTWLFVISLEFWLCISLYMGWARAKMCLPVMPSKVVAFLGMASLTLYWRWLTIMHEYAPYCLCVAFIITWSADTAAYFGGRYWGKNQLAPLISPQKTWEGLWASLIFTLGMIILAISNAPSKGIEWSFCWRALVVGLFTWLAAVIGDLLESYLKRLQGLKNSGQLLPGHGGILDRFDSSIAAISVFASCAYWLRLIIRNHSVI